MSNPFTPGPGIVEVIKVDASIMEGIDRSAAQCLGISVEEYRTRLKEEGEKHWCKCPKEVRERFDTIYHDNGRITNQHCVKKHHYHCGKCKKLTQIG